MKLKQMPQILQWWVAVANERQPALMGNPKTPQDRTEETTIIQASSRLMISFPSPPHLAGLILNSPHSPIHLGG